MSILNILSEFMYILCGIVTLSVAIRSLKNEQNKYTTFLFWLIISIMFIFSKLIPSYIIGALIIVISILTLTKKVSVGQFSESSREFRLEMSKKYKNLVFIPALLIGVGAFLLLQIKGVSTSLALGLSAIISLIVAIIIFKPDVKETIEDTNKMVMNVGPSSFLPQLLTGLGAVFTAANVGEITSKYAQVFINEKYIITAIIAYCLAMAIFTMIMGNAFAAFSVITTGIAAPFLLSKGLSPEIVGALGMTAGFCGTLMTPMAANFNVVPAAVLEMKSYTSILKTQVCVAIPLLISHIILMYIMTL